MHFSPAAWAYVLASSAALVTGTDIHLRRNVVTEIADSYDFVVVGGGLAGLVLGNRLSEDGNHTVLVLEAGSDGEGYLDQINTPGDAYYKSLWTTPLNWAYYTIPQTNINNTMMEWPRGKVLGGSSAINGLYLNRPGEIEVTAWRDMLGDMDGADNWSWDSLYAAMKKSEDFTAPETAIASEGDITWDASSHGTTGPIHMSWPGYTFPMVGQFIEACQAAGVQDSNNTYGGENWGAYVATSAINPTNWTRSYSRSGYLDPLPPRSNYAVLPNAFVTKLLFDSQGSNITANAVQYSLDGGNTISQVNVSKEVILAAGTIGSPSVLMHSGVGPSEVLSAAGVDAVLALPGVGMHLQDHLSATLVWSTNQTTAGSLETDNSTDASSPEFLSYVNDAVAYVNSSVLFGEAAIPGMQNTIASTMSRYEPLGVAQEAVNGYYSIANTTLRAIFDSPIGQIELLIGNNGNGTINLGASIQHPFSQGQISINSSNPMDYPVINPNYLANPMDVQILTAGLQLARAIGQTEPLSSIMTETYPGVDTVSTADEWADWLHAGNVFTEYHPSSTCAMLPLEHGGVVDGNLLVHGLSNVRVADASVPPTLFAAHLMSSTYGVAERAAEIINAAYSSDGGIKTTNLAPEHGGDSGSNPVHNKPGTATAQNTTDAATTNAAGRVRARHVAAAGVIGAVLAAASFVL